MATNRSDQIRQRFRDCAFLAGALAAAWLVRRALEPAGGAYPFAPFYLATAVVAFRGRLWPAILALIGGFLLEESFFVAPDGEFRISEDPMHAMGALIYFGVSTPIIWLGVRTSRQRAELTSANRQLEKGAREYAAEAVESTRLLGGIIEGSRDLIAALDRNFRIAAFNRAYAAEFQSLFGKPVRIGMPLEECLAELPAEREKAMELWRRAFKGEELTVVWEVGEGPQQRRVFEIRFSPIRDDSGRLAGAAHVMREITERVRKDAEIRRLDAELAARAEAGERAFHAAFEQAALGMALAGLDLRFTRVNRRFCEMTGYAPDELLGETYRIYTHPDDLDRTAAGVAQLLRGERSNFESEKRYRRKNGELFWVHSSISLVRKPSGEPDYVIGIIEDITSRRETEAALRESESRLRRLWDSNIVGILYANRQGDITDANDAFLSMVGYTRPDLQNGRLRWREMTPPEYHALDERGLIEADERGACAPYEKVYIDKNGHRVSALLGFALLGNSRNEYICFALDLTARKLAEEALRESESRAHLAMEAGGLGFWDYHVATRRVRWSPEHNRIVGLPPDLHEGPVEVFFERVHPEDRERVAAEVQDALTARHDFRLTYRVVWPDGSIRWVSGCGRPRYSADGQPVRIIGVVGDVTSELEYKERLRQARDEAERANAAKDRFLASLSHELRTPLNPALLATSELVRDLSVPEPVRNELQVVQSQIQLEARLIDDLLDLTAITRGKVPLTVARIDARKALSSALQTVQGDARAKRIEIAVDAGARQLPVNADPTRLQQIFWNLLRNAIKFTPSGGRIELTASRKDPIVEIVVRDNGIGIDEEHLPRLFEPFFQGATANDHHYGGLGLGLAICWHLAELHDGNISVASEGKGLGSTFTVELPLANGAVPLDLPDLASAGDAPAQASTLRILLVEDHTASAEMLSRLLRRAGHTVETRDTVAGALAVVNQQSFDLLISDLGLPDGSGLDLMKQLGTCGLPGIALSGFGMEEDLQMSREAGFTEHLTKPVDVDKLRATLTRFGRRLEASEDPHFASN